MITPGGAPVLPGEEYGDIVNFTVSDLTRPVMIVDIQDETWLNDAELRVKVDEKMRRRMALGLPASSLVGIEFAWTVDVGVLGDVEPAFQGRLDKLPRDCLAENWKVDLLSQEGSDKMKAITVDILAAARKLVLVCFYYV